MDTLTKDAPRVHAGYDRGADILYLSLGNPRDDEGEDRPFGVVLRYDIKDEKPSGVTVIGYIDNGWRDKLQDLAIIVGNHLSVNPSEVITSINTAEHILDD
jgi:hypothetical protein